jgi:AcrR family transcriptional regulator
VGYEKGAASREAIIDAAAAVVRQRGFDATSFGDVCEALGISRGKLTHHFPTKEALFEAVLESRFDRFRQRVVAPLLDPAREPRARIVASLDAIRAIYLALDHVPGCYIGHTAMDLATRTPAMSAQLDRLLDDWRAAIAEALAALGRPHAVATRQAYLAVSAIQGGVLMARAQPEKRALIETIEELQHTLLASASPN